jgi:phosphate transport system permease protein
MSDQQHSELTHHLVQRGRGPLNLKHKFKIHEAVIQVGLFACGLLSIFTTLGIILVLGNESIAFFTRDQWVNSNRPILSDMDDQTTIFTVEPGKALEAVEESGIIRVGQEVMDVVEFQNNQIDIDVVGTGGGFKHWCASDVDLAELGMKRPQIVNASRPVRQSEIDRCRSIGITPIPFRVGTDALAITASSDNDFITELTFAELKQVFGEAEKWSDVRADWPDDLKILALDGVAPSGDTVEDGSYALSRPLFIYSDADIMREQPQATDFISYYLEHVNDVIVDVGYFQASSEALAKARNEWIRATGAAEIPATKPTEVSGALITAGSSTVFPLTERIGEMFVADGYLPRFEVKRGVRGENTVAPHSAGVAVEYNDRPTLLEFFTNTNWIPAIGEFGVIPLINATLMTSTIAMLVALPLGIGAAVYLSEYASPRVRSTLKPALEILAGIPTVVYGYFALTFMTPLLRGIFGVEVVNIYNTGSAGIVVGILIIPLISSMSEDALHAVPQDLREASYGLGATKLETVIKVVIPAALSGILAAFIVAVSRAIGETMIVAIAAGAGPNFSFNPFDSAETMTGHIARISGGDLSYDSIDYNSIFAIGLTLFLMTFILNALSRVIISRFRETY